MIATSAWCMFLIWMVLTGKFAGPHPPGNGLAIAIFVPIGLFLAIVWDLKHS